MHSQLPDLRPKSPKPPEWSTAQQASSTSSSSSTTWVYYHFIKSWLISVPLLFGTARLLCGTQYSLFTSPEVLMLWVGKTNLPIPLLCPWMRWCSPCRTSFSISDPPRRSWSTRTNSSSFAPSRTDRTYSRKRSVYLLRSDASWKYTTAACLDGW